MAFKTTCCMGSLQVFQDRTPGPTSSVHLHQDPSSTFRVGYSGLFSGVKRICKHGSHDSRGGLRLVTLGSEDHTCMRLERNVLCKRIVEAQRAHFGILVYISGNDALCQLWPVVVLQRFLQAGTSTTQTRALVRMQVCMCSSSCNKKRCSPARAPVGCQPDGKATGRSCCTTTPGCLQACSGCRHLEKHPKTGMTTGPEGGTGADWGFCDGMPL